MSKQPDPPANPLPAQNPQASSASSASSQDGNSPSSTAQGSTITLVEATANGEPRRPALAKKPTMTSRISGVFGRRPTSDAATPRDISKAQLAEKMKDMTVNEGQLPARNGSNGSTSVPSRQSSQAKKSTGIAAETKSKAPVTDNRKLDDNGQPLRFWLTPNGGHEHQLKVTKRNQKLKDMLRNFFEKKEKPHEGEAPLTLMADWVAQKRTEEKANPETRVGPTSSQTLVQKYGKCQEIVGHGAFGIVRVAHKTDAKDPKREQLFAVKEFRQRPGESAKKYQKRLTSEFCLSSSMQHPNVIHTLDLLQDDKGDYCEVMEYCAGGDLYTLILAAGSLEVAEADCYFKQLMRGVEYMHEMGVAHRDLKPENLLLTQHGSLKITDFGNGECFRMAWEQQAHMTAGLCGSAPYIAPEEYVEKEFDPRAVDAWACGIIYMAMRTGRHLWRVAQKDEDEFFTRYLEDRKEEAGFRPIEVLRRRQCRNVIYSILDPNPVRRLTAHQILQSEWIKEVKVCKAGDEGF
ncbi:Pkinase-domain-containing protein [Venturia effusa]|uniref:non-specific serine/threonine protein kinase n=1 Tax=Venturia effusa TaxID=50376 RepID=A0A517L300_9PEZI|nr:Pkinase-domain-containing protein [Venturia effusa]